MTYAAARARIVTVLEGVSIATPDGGETMRRVYTSEPRESTYERPCVVLGPWSRAHDAEGQRPNLLRTRFVQRAELMLQEEDRERLIELIESWQDAIIAAFYSERMLDGNASYVSLPDFDEWESDEDGPDTVTAPFALVVGLSEGVTYAP